jgi:hypothetical protein
MGGYGGIDCSKIKGFSSYRLNNSITATTYVKSQKLRSIDFALWLHSNLFLYQGHTFRIIVIINTKHFLIDNERNFFVKCVNNEFIEFIGPLWLSREG